MTVGTRIDPSDGRRKGRTFPNRRTVKAAGVAAAIIGAVWSGSGWGQVQTGNAPGHVAFPGNFADGVHYTTVNRGGIREEIFVNRDALEAAKNGDPLPSGTVITLVDYRGGQVFRYVVMEKRTGWGSEYPPEVRNGEWEFQAFNADKTVNGAENLERCFACHKSQAANDYVFTLDAMKATD